MKGLRNLASKSIPKARMHVLVIRADGTKEDHGYQPAKVSLWAWPRMIWIGALMRAGQILDSWIEALKKEGGR